MAYSVSAIFDFIAPKYASDPRKDMSISLATDRTNTCFYGNNANQAIALRAAHILSLVDRAENGNSEGGNISSKREGDLAISFGSVSSSDNDGDLGMTSYGRQLQGLTKGSSPFIGVTGGNDNGCC